MLFTGTLQHCISGRWLLSTASKAMTELIIYADRIYTTEANTKRKRIHMQSPCLLLNTRLTVPLPKGTANYHEPDYDKICSVYRILFVRNSVIYFNSSSSIPSLSSVYSHIWGNWLTSFGGFGKILITPTTLLLLIILIHSSGPIMKFQHLGCTYDLPVEQLNW